MQIDINKVSTLVSAYLADPNCRPLLWIECEAGVTPEEKEKFLSLVAEARINKPFKN